MYLPEYVRMCVCVCVFDRVCVCTVAPTHRVEEHSQKQLSSMDAFVQFFRSTRIFLIVDRVSEQATRLTREHLHTHTGMWKEEL